MTVLNAWKRACAVFVLCAATAIAAPAQTFTTLFSFDSSDGFDPMAPLSQGTDGNLYGPTYQGGAYSNGALFKFGGIHGFVLLYNFCERPVCTDGTGPLGGLLPATDGYFYGTTNVGGASDNGTVFKITSDGSLTTLHRFDLNDGSHPQASLIQATDGGFYGTTLVGGSNIHLCSINIGCGTVFRITADGVLKTVHSFHESDGAYPESPVIQASDGNLYGTTTQGGTSPNCANVGCGTVFTINSHGVLVTLYSFCSQTNCTDGNQPVAGLVQATDGNFYGTTVQGGSDYTDCMGGCGTVFRITPSGTLSILHNFELTDGAFPGGALIQATDGNLYGTAAYGGDLSCIDSSNAPGCGTIFTITLAGAFTTLHNLELTEGAYPEAGLYQATDGNFYGVATVGGVYCEQYGCGSLFRLSTGLSPFVSFVRTSGRVGQTGPILGQGFTGTTSVSLNGIPASFTVVSDTYIRATVPAGAATGYVTVATPSGPLTSNVPFHVIQ